MQLKLDLPRGTRFWPADATHPRGRKRSVIDTCEVKQRFAHEILRKRKLVPDGVVFVRKKILIPPYFERGPGVRYPRGILTKKTVVSTRALRRGARLAKAYSCAPYGLWTWTSESSRVRACVNADLRFANRMNRIFFCCRFGGLFSSLSLAPPRDSSLARAPSRQNHKISCALCRLFINTTFSLPHRIPEYYERDTGRPKTRESRSPRSECG